MRVNCDGDVAYLRNDYYYYFPFLSPCKFHYIAVRFSDDSMTKMATEKLFIIIIF